MRKTIRVHYEPPVRTLNGWDMRIAGTETKIEQEDCDMVNNNLFRDLLRYGKIKADFREIFEEIEKLDRRPIPESKAVYVIKESKFAELKKKYTEGV